MPRFGQVFSTTFRPLLRVVQENSHVRPGPVCAICKNSPTNRLPQCQCQCAQFRQDPRFSASRLREQFAGAVLDRWVCLASLRRLIAAGSRAEHCQEIAKETPNLPRPHYLALLHIFDTSTGRCLINLGSVVADNPIHWPHRLSHLTASTLCSAKAMRTMRLKLTPLDTCRSTQVVLNGKHADVEVPLWRRARPS